MHGILFILLLFCLLGCNPGHYESVPAHGMEYGEWRGAMLFVSPSVGLIGGDINKPTTPSWGGVKKGENRADAICWRTTDGGVNWARQTLDDGTLSELTERDGIIYALVRKVTPEGDALSVIYTSGDGGESWRKKCESRARGVRFHVVDSNWLIMNTVGELQETRDGGKTWNILDIKKFVGDEFYDGRYVYYFSFNIKRGFFNLFIRRDLHTGEEREMRLPEGYNGGNGSGDMVFLRYGDGMKVYRINDDFTLSFLSEFKRGPYMAAQFIARHEQQVYLLLFSPGRGFFTCYKCFSYSSDGGKHWKTLGNKRYLDSDGNMVSSLWDGTSFRLFFYQGPEAIGKFREP